jgi:aryl-alcohol dehydrogenase-like predicted oxidoreductase
LILRSLGPGAPSVTAIGYGGMHLSVDGRPPESQALRVLGAVLDAGVTLIDTADAYCLNEGDVGHNERLIAAAIRAWGGDRSTVIVATKGGVIRQGERWGTDGSPAHLRAACERSLRALGVERLDLYQLHAPDSRVPFAESVGAMAELQRQGKVRWIGLSNVSVDQIREAASIAPVTSVQNRLNPFFRGSLTEGVVRHCADQGIGFLAYSPTGGGRLNLRLPAHPVVARLARRLGASPHAVVLAWVLSRSPTVIAIPSARSTEHALDSVSAAGLTLSPDDLSAIDAAEFSRA